MTDRTMPRFQNALRIMTSIDAHELVNAGVLPDWRGEHAEAWDSFARDPYRWFLRATDAQAEALWRLIESRQRDSSPDYDRGIEYGIAHGRLNEREACAQKAREYAEHYSPGSDGRNTFILLAEWIEARGNAEGAA